MRISLQILSLLIMFSLAFSACGKEESASGANNKEKRTKPKNIDDIKSSEARVQMKSIGDGALASYQKGLRTNSMDLTKPPGPIVNEYPTEKNTTGEWLKCTTTGNGLGERQVPNSADYKKSPWRDVMFYIGKPHFYQYCYESDGKTFTVTATASFKGQNDSVYELRGTVQDGVPVIGVPIKK